MRRKASAHVALIMIAAIRCAEAAPDADTAHASATDVLFARWANPDSPGCAVAVYRNDEIVFDKGYGMAQLELAVPIAPDTVFDIGSTSKQFTAMAILLLERDGTLSLNDDVRKHIPELPDYGKPITIRHLLQHTSGLRDYIELLLLAGVHFDDVATAAQTLAMIARQQAPIFEAGSEHLYSNSGYFLASIIVERASGKSLRRFAHERIFEPLGMSNTFYRDDHAELKPKRAAAYAPADERTYRLDQPNWEQTGDGAVHTTLGDLLLWDRNFYAPKVGDATLLARMQAPGVLNNGEKLDYGLGLVVDEHRGLRRVHHGGSWGGYRAQLVRFPSQHLSVATLCNNGAIDAGAMAMQVAEAWLPASPAKSTTAAEASATAGQQASKERPTVSLDAKQLQSWVGAYRSDNRLRFITLDDRGLRIEIGSGHYGLRPVGTDEAELVDAPFEATYRLQSSKEGKPVVLVQSGPDGIREFKPFEVDQPSAETLEAYAGRYRCDQLDFTHSFEVAGDTLQLRDPRGKHVSLRPLEAGEFRAASITVRFESRRDDRFDIAIFETGRARDLRCNRAHPHVE